MPEEEVNRHLPGEEQTNPVFFKSVQELDERWLALSPPNRQRELVKERYGLKHEEDIDPNLEMIHKRVRNMRRLLPHADNVTIRFRGVGASTSVAVHHNDWLRDGLSRERRFFGRWGLS